MMIAITRAVSAVLQKCELTHLERQPIDLELARAQHQRYEETLAALGCQVIRLAEEPNLPDSVFVEDTALVLDELAIITRPGAASRRPETTTIAAALAPYRPLYYIQEPATIDGGDILRLGKTIYVGLSSRSNFAAIEQMQAIVAAYGYQVSPLKVSGCLHLKSAITQIGEDMLLINPAWVDTGAFAGWKGIHIDASEPYAANTVLVGATLLYPIGYPRTQQRLEEHGIAVHGVDVSELIKAEGAVTCCSLLFHSYTSRQTQYTSHGHIL